MGDVTSIAKYDEPLVKPEVVAEFLGVEVNSVLRMARNKQIPALKVGPGGKLWRFRMSDIKEWVNERAEAAKKALKKDKTA
ncbi:MAG: helix-turn-helix domain-containing protein [Patescibacteria group bacterium]|nr:helix-turn-helix domain-containing protein [Patescibacteria group bacterium]